MAIKKIVTIPSPILNKKSEEIKEITAEIKEIAQDLLDTVASETDPAGAGLAAPQIGINKRICVVRDFDIDPENPEKEKVTDYVLINPEIQFDSNKTTLDWEGCLSVPNTYGMVKRFKKIKLKALDENGKKLKISTTGLLARTIQHEVDHLNGILFTTKVTGKLYTEKELDNLYAVGDTKLA